MSDADLFNEATAGIGGRLILDNIIPAGKSLLENEIASANKYIISARTHPDVYDLPSIYYDIVNNPEINARAIRYKNRYFIAPYIGARIVLFICFNRMLADPKLLPDVGDPSREIPNLPAFPLLEPEPNAEKLFNSGLPWIIPRDPIRCLYAEHLRIIAIGFLIGHELTHIVNGHVDYWKDILRCNEIPELGFLPDSADKSLAMQTLEMDADRGAILDGIGAIWAKLYDPTKKVVGPLCQFYKDIKQCAFDWSFAICTFFRLFGDTSLASVELAKRSHPPFRSRHAMAILTAGGYAQTRFDPSLIIPFNQGMGEAAAHVENAFSCVTRKPPAIKGLQEAYEEPGQAYVGQLIAHWKNDLRSKLIPFSYKKPLPD